MLVGSPAKSFQFAVDDVSFTDLPLTQAVASVNLFEVTPTEGGNVAGAGSETSRRHVEIRRDGALFILRDLGSTNGTFRSDWQQVVDDGLAPGGGAIALTGRW